MSEINQILSGALVGVLLGFTLPFICLGIGAICEEILCYFEMRRWRKKYPIIQSIIEKRRRQQNE